MSAVAGKADIGRRIVPIISPFFDPERDDASYIDGRRLFCDLLNLFASVAAVLVHFAQFLRMRPSPAEQNPNAPVLGFSAEAVCELVPGGKYRVVEFKPGNFRFGD